MSWEALVLVFTTGHYGRREHSTSACRGARVTRSVTMIDRVIHITMYWSWSRGSFYYNAYWSWSRDSLYHDRYNVLISNSKPWSPIASLPYMIWFDLIWFDLIWNSREDIYLGQGHRALILSKQKSVYAILGLLTYWHVVVFEFLFTQTVCSTSQSIEMQNIIPEVTYLPWNYVEIFDWW